MCPPSHRISLFELFTGAKIVPSAVPGQESEAADWFGGQRLRVYERRLNKIWTKHDFDNRSWRGFIL